MKFSFSNITNKVMKLFKVTKFKILCNSYIVLKALEQYYYCMKTATIISLALVSIFFFSCAAESSIIKPATMGQRVDPKAIDFNSLAGMMAEPGSSVLLLDVRTSEEYADGHIPGSVLKPYDEIADSFVEVDKSRPVAVYCRSGRRSAIAVETLRGMGYTNVWDLGGITGWKGTLEK
jgi:rhodanese-related sulfurtransferase